MSFFWNKILKTIVNKNVNLKKLVYSNPYRSIRLISHYTGLPKLTNHTVLETIRRDKLAFTTVRTSRAVLCARE